jgi:hypothetical protein
LKAGENTLVFRNKFCLIDLKNKKKNTKNITMGRKFKIQVSKQ